MSRLDKAMAQLRDANQRLQDNPVQPERLNDVPPPVYDVDCESAPLNGDGAVIDCRARAYVDFTADENGVMVEKVIFMTPGNESLREIALAIEQQIKREHAEHCAAYAEDEWDRRHDERIKCS